MRLVAVGAAALALALRAPILIVVLVAEMAAARAARHAVNLELAGLVRSDAECVAPVAMTDYAVAGAGHGRPDACAPC